MGVIYPYIFRRTYVSPLDSPSKSTYQTFGSQVPVVLDGLDFCIDLAHFGIRFAVPTYHTFCLVHRKSRLIQPVLQWFVGGWATKVKTLLCEEFLLKLIRHWAWKASFQATPGCRRFWCDVLKHMLTVSMLMMLVKQAMPTCLRSQELAAIINTAARNGDSRGWSSVHPWLDHWPRFVTVECVYLRARGSNQPWTVHLWDISLLWREMLVIGY